MTREIELLKGLRSAVEKEKQELEKMIDELGRDYAKTSVDIIFGAVAEENIPEAKVKNVALLLTGSIAKATLKSIEENLEELTEAIKELEAEMKAEETEETEEELSEEMLEKAVENLVSSIFGAIKDKESK